MNVHSFQHSIHFCHCDCQIAVPVQKSNTILGIAYAFGLRQNALLLG